MTTTLRPAASRLRRLAVSVLAGAAGLVGLAGLGIVGVGGLAPTPAYAHDQLLSSQPKNGASFPTASQGPQQIVLSFDLPVGKRFGQVAVTGPDGKAYADGALRVSGTTATERLRPLGPEGKYLVGWRVVSADGHPVSGSFVFWIGSPGSAETGVDATANGGGGSAGGLPIEGIGLGAIVVVLALLVGILAYLRRGRGESAGSGEAGEPDEPGAAGGTGETGDSGTAQNRAGGAPGGSGSRSARPPESVEEP